jgi:hypothetical protein
MWYVGRDVFLWMGRGAKLFRQTALQARDRPP